MSSSRDMVVYLASASDATPEMIYSAWSWLAPEGDPAMAGLVAHRSAPPAVLDAAAVSHFPAVRAAWLLRPERDAADLSAALSAERRADVLAAVASSDSATPQMLDQLAALHKRGVAWVLLGRELTPDQARHVLATLEPALKNASAGQRSKAMSFASKFPEVTAELAPAWSSPDLLGVAARSTVPISVEAQQRCLDVCVTKKCVSEHPKSVAWNMSEEVALSLLRRDDVEDSTVATIIAHFSSSAVRLSELRDVLETVRTVGQGALVTPGRVAVAATESSPDKLREMWSSATSSARRELAEQLLANPGLPVDVFVALSRISPSRPRFAERLAAFAESGELTPVMVGEMATSCGALVPQLVDTYGADSVRDAVFEFAAGARHVRAGVVLESAGLWNSSVADRIAVGELWRMLGLSTVRESVSQRLVTVLGTQATAWSLFAELADSNPSLPLAEVLTLVTASLS